MSASNDSSVNAQNPHQHKIFTVPNLLSAFRLALIPVFIWLYCFRREYGWTAFVLILSGLTDIVDGFIARHFHMISDLGKMLDPVADKLTQGAMLFCLMTAFPFMMIPLILLVVKETIAAVTGLIINKAGLRSGLARKGNNRTFVCNDDYPCNLVPNPAAVLQSSDCAVCRHDVPFSGFILDSQHQTAQRGKSCPINFYPVCNFIL